MTSALRPLLLAAVLAHPQSAAACPAKQVTSDYARRVERALFAKRDVWGEALIRSAAGPTYDAVRRHLTPLLLVGRPAGTGGQRLTDSGVYYLAFGQPRGPAGRGPVALHVADGGQIVWNRADGPKVALDLGREQYGSCLARLATPNLAGGWLPILETRYVDARGIRYRQESFAAGEPLASFVRLTVDTRPAPGVQVRFAPSRGAPLVVPVAAGAL